MSAEGKELSYFDSLDFPGMLNKVSLNSEQFELFLEYASKLKGDNLLYILSNIFSRDDMFKLLDILGGKTIKYPKRKEIMREILYIRIYSFVKIRGYDEKSVWEATKVFNKRANSIVRIYNKVNEVLTSDTKDFILTKEIEE